MLPNKGKTGVSHCLNNKKKKDGHHLVDLMV